MRYLLTITLFLWLGSHAFAQTIRIKEPVRFLALGDSYTIGQMYALWVQEIIKYIEREVGLSDDPSLENYFSVSTAGSQITLQSTMFAAEYRIYNLAGEEIGSGSLPAYSRTVHNPRKLSEGIYFVSLVTEDKRRDVMKIYLKGN